MVWMRCVHCGYSAKFPPDSHRLCLRHALCTADFRPYDPKECPPSATTIATLLELWYLARLEPEHASIHHCWANLVDLCSKHGRTAAWADPDLPRLLGFDHPARVLSSLLIQFLLWEPGHPEEPSLGFGPL